MLLDLSYVGGAVLRVNCCGVLWVTGVGRAACLSRTLMCSYWSSVCGTAYHGIPSQSFLIQIPLGYVRVEVTRVFVNSCSSVRPHTLVA